MNPAASSRPIGSDDDANISWNWSICDAAARAARNPRNIAAPPNDGVGYVWTLRGPGSDTAPMRGAMRRNRNVLRNVVSAPTPPTIRYPTMATKPSPYGVFGYGVNFEQRRAT